MSKYKIIFFGTPSYSVPTLDALVKSSHTDVSLVITQEDKPVGRGGKIRFAPVKEYCLQHNLPVLQYPNIKKNTAEFLEECRHYADFDLGVVIAFGQILPQTVLDLPRNGCVNLHASILPEFRGASPIQSAIYAGRKETGVSLMRMEAGLDSGPVYAVKKTPIEQDCTAGKLHDRLSQLSAEILLENISSIINQEIQAKKQDHQQASYAHKLESGFELIDWNQSATQVLRKINALSPYPAAYTFFNLRNKALRCKIIEAEISEQNASNPGLICYTDKRSLIISCREQAISVKRLQVAGKKAMEISEFLSGFTVENGQKIITTDNNA